MGRAKALLPIGDDTFLTRIVRTFLDAGVDDVVVVVGHDEESIVRPTSGSRHGHPLLLDRSMFDELRAADPETGAKPVVRAHASSDGDIDIADEGAFTDIDTADDYKRATLSGLTSDADRRPRRQES